MTSTPTPRTVADTRWDCGGCTKCCRHFALGPVSDEIVQGLHALQIQRDWAPAAEGFAVQREGPQGTTAWFLRRRDDGACIFLREDGLCAVHALHGAQAKPSFCREYPFMLIEEPDLPPAVVVRGDCGGWAESFQEGAPIVDATTPLLSLKRAHPAGRFHLDPIPLLRGVGIGQGQWAAVEDRLEPLLRQPAGQDSTIEQIVSRSCQALHQLVGRPAPDPDPERYQGALGACSLHLRRVLRPAVEQPPGDDPEIRGMHAFLRESLELLDAAASELHHLRRLDPSASQYLSLVLRNELLGRLFQPLGGLPPWLGSAALGVRIASAACPGQGPIPARELGPRLATWIRLTRHATTQRFLIQMRPALIDLFEHASPDPGA
ncbi:MAG: hypothetical protein EA397_02880 [Deltaproteobacteria bacterium]|nr:MAG: hypothetical protein EA397_02880 [Deltaproteobacteria bacterium]